MDFAGQVDALRFVFVAEPARPRQSPERLVQQLDAHFRVVATQSYWTQKAAADCLLWAATLVHRRP